MKISSKNVASFDVDAQYAFTTECPDELPVIGATDIVDELNQQAKFAHYRMGSKDAHPANAIWITNENNPILTPITGENVDVRWPRHAVPGTRGFELIAGLPKITEYDFFVWKGIEPDFHPYGACYHDLQGKLSTGLIEFLQVHDIKLIIVGGLVTSLCVKVNVLQLLKAGFKVIVNLGACRGISPESSAEAIAEMTRAGAMMIQSADELPQLIEYSLS